MRIESVAVVNRPAEVLFKLSQDYDRRLEWDNYLSEAYLLEKAREPGIGVKCHCKSRSGTVLVSRYISFSPPTHAAVEMVQGPFMLQRFGGTWRFRQIAEQLTEVRFIYNIKVKPRILNWLLGPLVVFLYWRNMQRRLSAFKVWAESAA
jgi:ribosome-associated toxin RatA of RatAB toxin-antitoxin module